MQERPSDKGKEVLTVEEIAEDLRVSEGTVRRWIRQGKLPAFGLGQYRIRRPDYENSSTNIAQGELTSTSILHFSSQYLWKATFGSLYRYLKDRGMWWPSSFQIEHYIGYWLFYAQRCVAHAFAEVLRAHCVECGKPYVITPPQWGVLSLLRESDGLTVGTISQKRVVDAPTITGIVQWLEQSGLVERRHSHEDRRVVKVYLTAEGRNIIPSLMDVAQGFQEVALRGFSQAEQQDFLVKLQQIIANVSPVAAGTGDRFGLLSYSMLCQRGEDIS